MRSNNALTCFILLTLQSITVILGCSFEHVNRSTNSINATQFPMVIAGSNAAADSVTTGFTLNHFSYTVNNLAAMTNFYTQVLGFRLIFRARITEKMSVSYLAHSHGGKNGTAYQTVAELNRNKNNMEGLLEFVHYEHDQKDNLNASTFVPNTFSHAGIVVPDLKRAQAQLDKYNVQVIKRFGEDANERALELLANVYGLAEPYKNRREEALEVLRAFMQALPDFKDLIFFLDPDGNYVEMQSQEMKQLDI